MPALFRPLADPLWRAGTAARLRSRLEDRLKLSHPAVAVALRAVPVAVGGEIAWPSLPPVALHPTAIYAGHGLHHPPTLKPHSIQLLGDLESTVRVSRRRAAGRSCLIPLTGRG